MPIEPTQQILSVEADFHFREGVVAIRLYVQEEPTADRDFLNLGALCNCVADLRRPVGQRLYSWSGSDEAFLRFLGRTVVPKFSPAHYKLGLFTVSEERFQEWRRQFAKEPGRFINRDDQRPIPPPGQTAAVAERFVLSEQGAPSGFFRMEAFILFPDGSRTTAHELLRSLGGDPNRTVTRSELFRAVLPVPWSQLTKYFNRTISTIQKTRAPELLPALLCNHLELLEGPSVVRQAGTGKYVPELLFSCHQQKFLVQGRVHGRPLPFDGKCDSVVLQLFVNSAGKLVLVELPPSPPFAAALEVLRELARHRLAEVSADAVSFPENEKAAEYLMAVWRSLPKEVRKVAAPEMRGLLADERKGAALLPNLTVTGQGGVVQVKVEWQVGGQPVSGARLEQGIRRNATVLQDDHGHWLAIDPASAAAARERLWAGGFLDEEGESMLFARSEAARALRALSSKMTFSLADEPSRKFTDGLLKEPPVVLPPIRNTIRLLLRPYQQQGVDFLADRALCGVGSLLADDMGLGKTLQVLAVLQSFRDQGKGEPFLALVVCPGSVAGVWLAQAREFFPELPVRVHAGPPEQRAKNFREHGQGAIWVTHYGLLRTDLKLFQSRQYDFLVADEAQFLKNPDALATLAIKSLEAKHKIALTGTPLENRMLDLWSIMDFLNPGYLGNRELFQSGAVSPTTLAHRLAPLMLRRTKQAVAAELPPRSVTVLSVTLGEDQRKLYDEEVVRARDAIREAGPVQIFAALTRLRELCCDPELLLKHPHALGSAKLELLLDKCEELLAGGHSVLVFSQFASMLRIISRRLAEQGLEHQLITGETPMESRPRIVRQFQEGTAPSILLLALKAAGTGLTLTRADYVFLYDPWWNPAAEEQAIDRTHRIGQVRPVFAYRLIAQGTVEERVLELLAAKRELFSQVVNAAADQAISAWLTREDLAALIG